MAHITVTVPARHPMAATLEVHADSPQLIRIYYNPPEAPPPDHRVLGVEGGWGGVPDVVLGTWSLTTVTGEITVGTWHWDEPHQNWHFNDTRVRQPIDSPLTPTPAVRETDPVNSSIADVSLVLEAEDLDYWHGDWNDAIVRLSWPGRVIGALSWANDPAMPVDTHWPEIDVFKHAHVYLESLRGPSGGIAQVEFLGSGGYHDLVRGKPVIVPSDQRIRIVTQSPTVVSCVARIIDKL